MFKGIYYKHQVQDNTVCFIVGEAKDGEFLQVLTNERVYHFTDFKQCSFSNTNAILDLPNIKGTITYSNLTPLKSDIMGFFRFFPMQCRHSVISMNHTLSGGISIDGEYIDFNGGRGYIEGDSGRSFPKKYLWLHCNDFPKVCSIMASVADIPFLGFHFQGCICAIVFNGKEYRLATYHGVKVKEISENKLILSQKKLRLEIDIEGQNSLPLKMPIDGRMTATVYESNSTRARFKFYENDKLLFDFFSNNTSFEYNF